MQIFTTVAFPALLAAGLAACQDEQSSSGPDYSVRTEPFYLKLQSAEAADLDGQYLAAYHSGAAIEQLGLGGPEKDAQQVYYVNSTECAPEVQGDPVGILTWNLPIVDMGPISSGLRFQPNGTDIVMLTFFPGPPDVQDPADPLLGFDEDEKMFLYAAPEEDGPEAEPLYEWFFCSTYFGGYNYNALTWVPGGETTAESCRAVNVVREFS